MAAIPFGGARGQTWTARSPRDEIRPAFERIPSNADEPARSLVIRSDARAGLQGWWETELDVEGGAYYRFTAAARVERVPFPRRCVFPRVHWRNAEGGSVTRDEPVFGPYHPKGTPATATPELPLEQRTGDDGSIRFESVVRAPSGSSRALIELHLWWAPGATVEWTDIRLEKAPAPPPRRARVGAVHFHPSGQSPEANRREFAPLIADAAAKGVELLVLPETLTFYGTGKTYAECAEPVPGPSTEYFGELAKSHKTHLVVGLLEKDGHLVHNVAVLIGADGRLIGKYRKVCLPRGESESGIMPGDAYPVFETSLGRIGMMVCYDGFFPEVARRLREAGAEVIAFPVWGCNPMLAAARACENSVFVVSSTYTDASSQWMITGIFGPDGSIVSRADQWGTIAIADIDLGTPAHWAQIGDFAAEMHRNRPPSAKEYFDAKEAPSIVPAPPRSAAPPAAIPTPGGSARFLRIPPREADEALAAFHMRDGFRMELLASEPLVEDPVAMEYDEWGRAYVVEMRDYPYTDKSTDKPFSERITDLPLGRVRLLTDTNGDGRFDHSSVFAENLSWPTGIAIWNGGIFVTATPDLWYLKDTDGDGKADERRRIFGGFRKFNVQAVINNLKWGMDHAIYGAGSSNGGSIVADRHPSAQAIAMSTHDFRFDPRDESFELLSGGGRFGHAFDDWGNRFICNIRNPIRHAVVPDRALRRNPLAIVSGTVHDVAESGDAIPVFRRSMPEPWRVENASRLASDVLAASPRSETVAAGYMTSACGLTIYRGSAYPDAFYGQAFLGEVAGNLIHRQKLVSDSVTFIGKRVDDRAEFVTSDDNWFRPVNFVNAPDGTLHVVDMYRETIEHPWSMPDDLKAQLDLESGRDRGRIYRLAPPGFESPSVESIRLGDRTSVELVDVLRHANAWHRDTAFRLLFERQDRSAVPALRALARRSAPRAASSAPASATRPDMESVSRVLALWTLQGLGVLEGDDVMAAATDRSPEVRRHAIRVAAARNVASHVPADRWMALARDSEPAVRFELALALPLPRPEDTEEVLRALVSSHRDRWLNTALVTAAAERESMLLAHLVAADPVPADASRELAQSLSEILAARGRAEEIEAALGLAQRLSGEGGAAATYGSAILGGVVRGCERTKRKPSASIRSDALRAWMSERIGDAARIATDRTRDAVARTASIRLLRQAEWPITRSAVSELLASREPPPLQLEAVRAAMAFSEPEAAALLVERYRVLSPSVRVEVLQELASRAESALVLLDAFESGAIARGELSPAQRGLLSRNRDARVRDRAAEVLVQDSAQRADVVASYRAALRAVGDPARGAVVYERVCSACHQFRGRGTDVGPPLESVFHRSGDELALHILDPSREVAPQFQEYTAQRADGRMVTGMIVEETEASVTLRRAGHFDETLLRSEIEQLLATGKSLMPEGLEQQITPEELNDLVHYVRSAQP